MWKKNCSCNGKKIVLVTNLKELKAVVNLSHICPNTQECLGISIFNVTLHHLLQPTEKDNVRGV